MNSLTLDDGVRLAYQVDGPEGAPALALINSLGTNLHLWQPQIDALSRRFRVVRHDMRGHGLSGCSPAPLTIDRLARDLLALLDHLGVDRAHLCGLSLGGMVAIRLAAHYPARINQAIFANTAARIGSVESWEARIAMVREGGMAAIRELVVARFLSEGYRARRPEVARKIGDMLENTSPEGYIAACTVLRDTDLRPSLGAVRAPSLIVAGSLDESTPPDLAQSLHGAIAGSELVVLDGAGHLSNVEQPDTFSARILRFLRPHEQLATPLLAPRYH